MGNAKRLVTAAFPSKYGPPEPSQGVVSQKRDIPKEHPFDPRSLKPMAKALWASSVALGHALTAYRHFTRLKSATVSPDGRLGGKGYIMGMAEIRQNLYEVCERLSSISDTLYDEINGPHWKPKLAQLDENDQEDVERFVGESQEVLENPEEAAEEEIEAIEQKNDKKKPKGKKKPPKEDEEAKGSELPDGGAPETSAAKPPVPTVKEASRRIVARFVTQATAEPGLPGPRVEDWDGGDGPFGSVNPPEDATSDEWGLTEGHPHGYDYPSEWDNDMSHQAAESKLWAESTLPSDPTPTEAWDFGIGYGARGQGAGGYANPSDEGGGRGVWGPRAGLPGVPDQSSGDSMAPIVDVNLNERHGEGLLPGDTADPVARRDEYEGPKGNLVQTTWAEGLPDGSPAFVEVDQPVDIDTGYVCEDLHTLWLPLGAPGMRQNNGG